MLFGSSGMPLARFTHIGSAYTLKIPRLQAFFAKTQNKASKNSPCIFGTLLYSNSRIRESRVRSVVTPSQKKNNSFYGELGR